MKILIKYICKLFIGPFLIGLGGFIVFVSVEILYQLSSIIVRHRVGISKLLLLVYYYLPYFTSMGIPVGVLLAIFWIVTELSARRELMALQVHGISLKSLILPFMIISSFLSLISFFLNDSVVPIYQEKAEMVLSKYIYKRAGVEAFIVENTLAKYENQYIYIRKYDEKKGIIEGVVLFRYDENGEEIITAEEVVREGNSWYLINGRYYRVDENGFLRFDSSFKKLKLDIGEDLETFLRVKKPRTMTGKELREKIKTLKKLGVNPSSWLVELHTRYSTALAPLIIVLVGLSLSLTFNLKSKSWGVILTFILIVLYQGSGAWLSAMGKERLIDPVLSAWIPDMAFSLVGLVLFAVLGTKLEYRLREILGRIFLLLILFIPSVYLSENIVVTCDESIFESGIATFTGNVRVFYRDVELRASTAVALFTDDGSLNRLEALNATLIDKHGELHANSMIFYPDSSLTELYVVSGYVATNRGKVELSSSRLYRAEGWIVLRDGVSVKIGDIEARGDFFKIISNDGEIRRIISPLPSIVHGKTEDGEYEILASSFEADPESSELALRDFNGEITFTQNKKKHRIYDYGEMARVTESGVEISGGYITTCSLKNPHYSINASKIVYRYGLYITAEHAVLVVLGIPVFYFPYFFTTVSRDVGFQLGFSMSKGFITSSLTFKHRYSKIGEMSFSRTGKPDVNVYSLKISDEINGYRISADYGFNEKDLEINGQNVKLKVSSPFPTKPTLVYEDLKDHSKIIYSLSGSSKFGKGKLNYTVSRTRSGNSTSYLLPSVKLSNLSLELFGGKLVLKSVFHKGVLNFSTGTVLDNLENLKSDGKIVASYGRTLFKDFGSSMKLSLTSNYSFLGASPTSYSGKVGTDFVMFSKKLAYGSLELTPKETLGVGLSFSKDGSPTLTLSENLSMKSKLSLGAFSVSADYKRSNTFAGEWESLKSTKKTHILKISSTLNVELIKTKFGLSTSYDFLKAEGNLSKPVLTTESAFEMSGIGATFKTSSVYDYENGSFEKTDLNVGLSKKLGDWNVSGNLKTTYTHTEEKLGKLNFSFAQNYRGKKFTNTITLSYDPNSESPLSDLVDSFSFKGLDISNFKKINLSGQIRLGLDRGIALKSLKSKGSFYIGKSKNSLSLSYTSSSPDRASLSLNYSLSSFDPQVKIGLRGSMMDGNWNFNKISIGLKKDLHCWIMTLSGVFSYSDGNLRIDKLLMKFQLKEFPDKFFSYDAKGETFDMNLF